MKHVALVLPGQHYGPELPALAIPVEVLRSRGAEPVYVRYPPAPWPDWRRAEAGDWSEITDALVPQISDGMWGADRVTVVAKSMGTSVFGGLRDHIPGDAEAIWLTPLFGDSDVRANAIAAGLRSLSVFGTADPMHDAIGQAEVTAAVGGVELAVVNANHALVVDGDEAATSAGYAALREAVEAFITKQ